MQTYDCTMYSVEELQGFLRMLDSRLIVAMHFGRMPSKEMRAKQAAAEAELASRTLSGGAQ